MAKKPLSSSQGRKHVAKKVIAKQGGPAAGASKLQGGSFQDYKADNAKRKANKASRVAKGTDTTLGQDVKAVGSMFGGLFNTVVDTATMVSSQNLFRGAGAALKAPAAVAGLFGINSPGKAINKLDSIGSTMNGMAALGMDPQTTGSMAIGSQTPAAQTISRFIVGKGGGNTRGVTGYVPRNAGLQSLYKGGD
jgi:hypothetical protein